MKKLMILFLCFLANNLAFAQVNNRQKVERACLDYLEGFYEGDTIKLIRSLKPTLYKFGYWRDKAGHYAEDGQMTFREALKYAANVQAKKNFAKVNAPKKWKYLI